METSLKPGFAQIFSCCPKNLSCPKFGGAAAPLAPPARTPMAGAKARGGEKRKVSFSPLHLPVHSSFLLSSQRSRRSPAEMLATRRLERSDSPQMLAGYAFLSKARRCNKYTNKLVIFDARSMFATDGNMLKRFVAHLCYGSLKVPWME